MPAPTPFLHLLLYAMAPATPTSAVVSAAPAPAVAVAAAPCNCGPEAMPAPSPWSGGGELGFASSTGNSTTESFNGTLNLTYEDSDWAHGLRLAGLRASAEYTGTDDAGRVTRSRDTTANRYTFTTSSARKLAEHRQLAAALRAEADDFASYDRQASFSIGYGTRLMDNGRTQFDLQFGPGYKWARHASDGAVEAGLIGRGFFDFRYALTTNTDLSNTLLVESGAHNTFAQNDFGISVSMNSHLALKAGWQARHNTLVDDNKQTTDTLTTMNVVYKLK